MFEVCAVEAGDGESFGGEYGAGGGARFIGAVRAVAVIIVDAGEGDCD